MNYYRGRTNPDDEPRLNRYRDEKRRSAFTEEVAAAAAEGDLYFAGDMPAAGRYYVPFKAAELVEDAEPGETALVCVTHKFHHGHWKRYDSGGNLVIKLNDHAYPEQEALDTVMKALYRTPLGRVVGRDALWAMAHSLCKAFGVETDGELESTFTVNPDAEAATKQALRDLLTYAPENGYPDELGKIGAECDGVGFAEDAVQYAALINGESDGFGKSRKGHKPLPLLSQPVFYAALGGKGDGRGFQNRIDALMQAVGLDEEDV